MKSKYCFGKTVFYSFEAAIQKVEKEFEKEGFRILADIEYCSNLEKKLNQEM